MMSRKIIFVIAALVVVMHFTIIVLMLTPLYGAKGNGRRIWPKLTWCKSLGFQSPRDTVALASFPGSGNTWLRYLLQQVTGIYTGSIYLDLGLKNHGFPAENIVNGTVLVVKTHTLPSSLFRSAVLLIRKPRDAILADFNRRRTHSHIMTAPKSAFKDDPKDKEVWSTYVNNSIKSWENFYKTWVLNFPGAVHIVFYEDLVQDTKNTLTRVLSFLRVNVSESDMACAMIQKQGIYYRRMKHLNFDPFTEEMYKDIEEIEKRVYKLVKNYKYRRNGNKIERKS